MSALKHSIAPVGMTVALALGGALALCMSCASSEPSNSSGGSGGNQDSSSSGGSGGSAGGSSGAGGSGGSSSFSCTPNDTNNVCFYEGAAKGLMTGWGWVSLGALDKITDPTCDTDKHEITNANACKTTTNWNPDVKEGLCISGTIPPLPEDPYQSDYDNNWGIQIGVNTSEPPGTTLGKDFSTVTLTFTGEPSSGNRAELHVKGDDAGTTYCAEAKSGKEIKLTSFNKACWDGTGADPKKGLTADKIPNIDKVGIQVSSVSKLISDKDIEVKNLCLMAIEFK